MLFVVIKFQKYSSSLTPLSGSYETYSRIYYQANANNMQNKFSS